jgi:hypothetical protein
VLAMGDTKVPPRGDPGNPPDGAYAAADSSSGIDDARVSGGSIGERPAAFLDPGAAPRPELHGDFSLNVTNSVTAGWVLDHGLTTLTAAHDLDRDQLLALLDHAPAGRIAVTVHHHIPTFHTEGDTGLAFDDQYVHARHVVGSTCMRRVCHTRMMGICSGYGGAPAVPRRIRWAP